MIALRAPDGMRVELIENGGSGDVTAPADDGFHSVTLWVRDPEPTARLLTELFGYQSAGEGAEANGRRWRLAAPGGGRGSAIDLWRSDTPSIGRQGAGTIHHVAFRAESGVVQQVWRERATDLGLDVTPLIDRQYFNAIYFREPGGVLFEIATDPPEDMLGLAEALALPDLACLAPAAAGVSWWPGSFLAPIEANEPGVSSGLGVLAGLVEQLEGQGFGSDRIVVMGFSQGACLALEYAARSGRRLQANVAPSGGLTGSGEADGPPRAELYGHRPKTFDYDAMLAGAPVYLGCHARDPHIPLARVRESAAVFEGLGATVRAKILPGSGHGVVEEEVCAVRGLLNR